MSQYSSSGHLLTLAVVAWSFCLVSGTCPPRPDCLFCTADRAVCKLCPDDPNIPATIKDLRIMSGGCASLTQNGMLKSLSRYTDLESLSLDRADVKYFFGAVFEKNVNLKTLSLSMNAIVSFSALTFRGLNRLLTLNLARSQITKLTPGSFTPLTSLETLSLEGNLLHSLSAQDFDGLGNLLTLTLSSNPLDTLEPETFKALSSVQEISLKGTELTAISSKLFSGLTALRRVDASDGKIRVVADDSLLGTRLDLLDLSHNALIAAPYAAIKSAAAAPKEVDLSHNRIFRLMSHDFQNVSIAKLSLHSNPISSIEAGAFSGSAISELDLSNTSLTSLPRTMDAWMRRQAVTINLQDNNAWQCGCSQLWLAAYLQGSAASHSPACVAGGQYAGFTLLSALLPIEADCKTTTALTTTTTTPTTTTTTTTSTTTTPTTTAPTASSPRKPVPHTQAQHVTKPAASSGSSSAGQNSKPPGQRSTPPQSHATGHAGPPGTTASGSSSSSNANNNNNNNPNTGNANTNNKNPDVATSKPGGHVGDSTSPKPGYVVGPDGKTVTPPGPQPGATVPGGGHSPGTGPVGEAASGTVNLLAVLLAVLCTLAACLFCVGVVAACLSCHKSKSRRGRVEDSGADHVAHALASLSGNWYKQK